jgi:hypothetical protein
MWEVACLPHIYGRATLELYRKRTGATGSVSLDLRSSLSIQPFEASRLVRGRRYGISIAFGLEAVEVRCHDQRESRRRFSFDHRSDGLRTGHAPAGPRVRGHAVVRAYTFQIGLFI